MHDQPYPDSQEAPGRISARALAALEYEERAGLGFRRRLSRGLSDPWSPAEQWQITGEDSPADLLRGFLGAIAVVCGVASFVYLPVLMGTIALAGGVGGLMGGRTPNALARRGIVVGILGLVIGMALTHWTGRPIYPGE